MTLKLRKLSEIATSTPAATDQVVGVSSGNVDNLYTVNKLPLTVNSSPISGGTSGKFLVDIGGMLQEADAHFPETTSNLDFYVDPVSGSDSNPGTSGSPFATIQRALVEAARFNWAFVFFPRIHLADGTYPSVPTRSIQIGNFVNLFETIIFIANNGSPQNVVLTQQFELAFSDGSIEIGGLSFTGVTSGSCVNGVGGTIAVSGPLIFNDDGQIPFFNEVGTAFTFVSTTLTVNATSIPIFSNNAPGSTWFSNPTINLPVALTVTGSFFDIEGEIGNKGPGLAAVILGGPTFSNFGGVTGAQLVASGLAFITTQHGVVADIPGNGVTLFDPTPMIGGFGTPFGTFYQSFASLPTTTHIPTPGTWRVMKDTSGGGVYVAANDGGVIKKVALT